MTTLTRLSTDSGKQGCPQVYARDSSTLVVQGLQVSDPSLRLDPGEAAVEICSLLVYDALVQLGGPMTMADLGRMFGLVSASMFRVEVRDAYLDDQEQPEVEHFARTGEVLLDHPDTVCWFDLLRAHKAAGRTLRRVHVVDLPLSDYLRWELAFQAHSPEDVRVLDRAERPGDDRVPVRLVYDADGRLVRPERMLNSAIGPIRDWQRALWEAGTPLSRFMQVVS